MHSFRLIAKKIQARFQIDTPASAVRSQAVLYSSPYTVDAEQGVKHDNADIVDTATLSFSYLLKKGYTSSAHWVHRSHTIVRLFKIEHFHLL